jgi:hypothetical protein
MRHVHMTRLVAATTILLVAACLLFALAQN